MFSKEEVEYLKECLNFHYSENDDLKAEIIHINANILKKLEDYDT